MLQHTRPSPFLAGSRVHPAAWPQPRPGISEADKPRAAELGRLIAPGVRLLRGREAVLAAQPTLADLAHRTAQAGEADSLEYFLSTPVAARKTPYALLLSEPEGGPPTAAVMLFEYRAAFWGSRVFASGDGSGRRDVLARPELRARAAARAARSLIEQGAHVVQVAFAETHNHDGEPRASARRGEDPAADRWLAVPDFPPAGVAEQAIAAELRAGRRRLRAHWSLDEHENPAYLPLLRTLNATLARIGQRTRSNLRYYRRRAEQDLGCRFVPLADLTQAEFLAFNRECTYAVPDAVAAFRYQAARRFPTFCVRGIRDNRGRWLSLVGTRRQHGSVEIDWQMNRADLPAYSLATVMRAYVIEHEIALGSTRLYIEGGTPQPIGRSFVRQRSAELTVKRDSAYVRLLERFAPLVFPPKNYVGQTLIHPNLHWKRL